MRANPPPTRAAGAPNLEYRAIVATKMNRMLRRSVRNLLSDGSSLGRPFETGFATVFIFGFSRTELAEFVDKSYLRFLQRYGRLAGYGSDEEQNVPLSLPHPSLAVIVPFRTVRNVLAYSESVCEEARF